jgi:Fur family transcriptional regulator, peroxide stress response regulator
MERMTCQKQIILNYLQSVKTHPTAEAVFLNVKKGLPHISKATVYRILNNLKEKGQIQEVLTSVSHYDGDLSPHAHFICENCGEIYDIFDQHCPFLVSTKTKVGKINKFQIYLYGKCKNCV